MHFYIIRYSFSGRESFSGQLAVRPCQLTSLNLEIWNTNKSQTWKFSEWKSVLPKMSARSWLVGEKSSRPHLWQFLTIFSMGRTKTCNTHNVLIIFLGGPIGFYLPGSGSYAGVMQKSPEAVSKANIRIDILWLREWRHVSTFNSRRLVHKMIELEHLFA